MLTLSAIRKRNRESNMPKSYARLSGRGAVVTGASSGIGRAVARAFSAEGARVVLNYRKSQSAAEALVSEIEAGGGEAMAVAANVAEPEDCARLLDRAAEFLGDVDVWANVAGADILTGAHAEQTDFAKRDQLIDVDLRGTMNCCWAVARIMKAQASGGVILNTSWDLALTGMGERNPEMFAASKAGVTGFTRSFARSVAPAIRVNEIAPGWITTSFAENEMSDDYRNSVIASTPLARFGTAEDVAAAAVFLCSDEAAFISGQTLKVNGGLSS